MLIATLSTTVSINWIDHKGCDRDCEVEVEYDFDGDRHLEIIKSRRLTDCDLPSWEFDEQVFDAVMDVALDAYPEWLAERDEWHAPETFIPARAA